MEACCSAVRVAICVSVCAEVGLCLRKLHQAAAVAHDGHQSRQDCVFGYVLHVVDVWISFVWVVV